MTSRFFIFGAGYSGLAIAREAIEAGGMAAGTTRSPEKAKALGAAGVTPLLFDGTSLSPEIADALHETTHLVISIAPDHGMRGEGADSSQPRASVDPVLAVARDTIARSMPALRWVGYLSTVGVYGDHDGAWIDEDSACNPTSRRSQMRLEAENEWLALGKQTGLPVAILRLSGIYGPGRNGLVNLASGTAKRIIKPGQVFNRIHVGDIAGAAMLLAASESGGIFNVTDDEPAPPQDVVAYAASLMCAAPPPTIAFDEAEMTPMARSFYGENKRVSNARLRAAGYRFRFPDYRAALGDLWGTGRWRG
ncbi:SDR family NAD(P)-dependent oxidoreductase [Mesorhizobium sp. CAU 1732]|uniref:SDR family NAD(P)-dependent oxidoreductase n=1 Tax=Mesorhizobium sp. CAU 1732 TaxID=3140358 RepID=UPI003261BB98